MTTNVAAPVEIFYSYAHEDEAHAKKLQTHLSILKRQGLINNWHDRQIIAGHEWGTEIDKHLESAHIILLLVSSDFIDFDYCWGREMTRALERHEAGGARVIPIAIRPVDWSGAPFEKLQGLPKDMKPVVQWPLLDDAFTDIATGLRRVVRDIQARPTDSYHQQPYSEKQIAINIKNVDVLSFPCDVMILKYAQSFHGADKAVFNQLRKSKIIDYDNLPQPGEYNLIKTNNVISARYVLFIGTVDLADFEYKAIREFARDALIFLAKNLPEAKHAAATVHGVGYGLDEAEALTSEIAGFAESFSAGSFPVQLGQLTIAEHNEKRFSRLREILHGLFPYGVMSAKAMLSNRGTQSSVADFNSIGYDFGRKEHVCVAMTITDDTEDLYFLGIETAVKSAGYLCEQANLSSLADDVLLRIKERIASAAIVIADISDMNPNVYLEVGYAWGCQRPTVLISRHSPNSQSDSNKQEYIIYKSLRDLQTKLKEKLAALRS